MDGLRCLLLTWYEILFYFFIELNCNLPKGNGLQTNLFFSFAPLKELLFCTTLPTEQNNQSISTPKHAETINIDYGEYDLLSGDLENLYP